LDQSVRGRYSIVIAMLVIVVTMTMTRQNRIGTASRYLEWTSAILMPS